MIAMGSLIRPWVDLVAFQQRKAVTPVSQPSLSDSDNTAGRADRLPDLVVGGVQEPRVDNDETSGWSEADAGMTAAIQRVGDDLKLRTILEMVGIEQSAAPLSRLADVLTGSGCYGRSNERGADGCQARRIARTTHRQKRGAGDEDAGIPHRRGC